MRLLRLRNATLLVFVIVHGAAHAADQAAGSSIWQIANDDVRWTAHTAFSDARSIVTAPLHIGRITEITPKQLLTGAAMLAGFGVAMALDESIRSAGRHMDHHAASTLQTTASTVSLSSLGALYVAGVAEDDKGWRHESLTGAEAVGVSSALVTLTKATFRRERPDSGQGSTAFFRHGDSFVSDAATPPYAAAEAVSAAFDHSWWATMPSYAMATAVGVGRIGQDRHWASDIVASAYLGAGTTAVFDFLHRDETDASSPTARIYPELGPERSVAIRFALGF